MPAGSAGQGSDHHCRQEHPRPLRSEPEQQGCPQRYPLPWASQPQRDPAHAQPVGNPDMPARRAAAHAGAGARTPSGTIR
eukprot:1085564-Lingulodinium_polyedra.AAC.1